MKASAGQVAASAGPAHAIAGQAHAIAGQLHAPAGQLGWFSYAGPAAVALAAVLVAAAAGTAAAGLALRAPVRLPSPCGTARTGLLVTWGAAVVAYLVSHGRYTSQLLQQHLIRSMPPQPILPITVGCMIALFAGIWYVGRSLPPATRLGSACTGALAGLMIFQFPFDLIVMTRVYPADPDPALYWTLMCATILVEVTTLALLSLSPLVRLSRPAFFAGSLLLLLFAIWAVAGFGPPSAPLPFAVNAASKVAAFVVALSLFLPWHGRSGTRAPTQPAVGGSVVPGPADPAGRVATGR